MNCKNIAEIECGLKSCSFSVRDLYLAWEQRQPIPDFSNAAGNDAAPGGLPQIPWLQNDVALARLFTARALECEEFLLVCDAAREVLRLWPAANAQERIELVRVRMDYAVALTRLGFARDARREIEPCVSDGFQPKLSRGCRVDIFIQLGNIMREESHRADVRAVRLQKAEEALGFYRRALALEPERLESLVLTAAASLILSDAGSALRHDAEEKARQILAVTGKADDANGPLAELTAARAVAQIILGDLDSAGASYAELSAIGGVPTALLARARYRAQFLAEAVGKPRDFFKQAFPPLQLIVFAGHLPDLPGGPVRFPAESMEAVRETLRKRLAQAGVRAGLVCAAAGADLLFIEALRTRNATVHVVLPWSQEEFRRDCVRPYEPRGQAPVWEPLFDEAIREAATVRELGQASEPGSDAGWSYMTEVTAGLALHTARVSRLDVQPMALWDGLPGGGAGGTADFVEFWRQHLRIEPAILDLPAPAAATAGGRRAVPRPRCEITTMQQEVKTMLFADIVGYSKLTEHVIPEFVEIFLKRVSQIAAGSAHAPRSVDTWGDAFYAVFDFAHDAGCFALELTQMIQEGESDWLKNGLYWEDAAGEGGEAVKHPINIRIGLHTGPVFIHYEPIVRRLGFTGAHVTRAARIEPVAKPGEVFASEEFAALAELGTEIERCSEGGGGRAGFLCEYAGTMQLAKGYPGRHRIYRVVPRRVFAIEELAEAAHDWYCIEARKRGDTPAANAALRAWKDLPEDLREANRAQVADIPNKLQMLGCELAPAHGLRASDLQISDAQLESLAMREHARWMRERQRCGWTYAPQRDEARKRHPLLIPWEQLSAAEQEKDRDTIRNLTALIEQAGFRVRRIADAE